jgi:undecaprenyl-diphosphatase
MTILEALILGVVQALTEFFPISSSAHLIIFPKLLGIENSSLTFDLVLHFGTATALIVFFWKDLFKISSSFVYDVFYHSFKQKKIHFSSDSRYGLYILIGSLPVIVVGLLFGSYIEEKLRQIDMVLIFLILGTILMGVAEYFARVGRDVKELGYGRALIVGFFQCLALLPGMSRSGSTISGGILMELSREEAGRFAFMMSIPVIVGASIKQLFEEWYLVSRYSFEMFSAYLTSFLVGLLALKLLLMFLKKGTLVPFIIYRVVLIIGLFFYINK